MIDNLTVVLAVDNLVPGTGLAGLRGSAALSGTGLACAKHLLA